MNFLGVALVAAIILGLIGAAFLIVWIFGKGFSNPSKKRVALAAFLFYISIFGSGLSVITTPPEIVQTDYSEPFSYSREILKEKDVQRSEALHTLLVSVGMNDPQGFIFQDTPRIKDKTRNIWVQPSTDYYLLHYEEKVVPSLVQVPIEWIATDKVLEQKAIEFLQVPQENSSLVEASVQRSTGHFSDMLELVIKVYDPNSEDMVLIALAYNEETGFAQFVNIVYTTINYSYDKPSLVYMEVAYYPFVENFIFGAAIFVSMAAFALAIVVPIAIFASMEGSLFHKLLNGNEKKGHPFLSEENSE